MSNATVSRLGTGSSIIVGPRVSRAIHAALLGAWPGGPADDAVLIDDASVIAAFLGTEGQIDELVRVNEELRKVGIEHPLGARGVHDLASVLAGYREEIDGILADAGVPYTARGVEGVRALLASFEAARAEVQRLDQEVKDLRRELGEARKPSWDPEDTIRQPIYEIEG